MADDRVPLREYVEALINAIVVARDTAYESMNQRLDGMNEFRDALRDQAGRFVTRDEVRSLIDGLTKDIKSLELSRAELQGKASQTSVNVGYVFTAIAVLISVIGLAIQFLK